jgi:ketosteroid isomerase-like protein
MSEHPNEALVRRAYAAFTAGELATFAELSAPGLVWNVAGNNRISGEHKGQEEVFALFALCGELTAGNMELTLETVDVEPDGNVVSTHHLHAARPDGRTLDTTETERFTVEGGKIVRVDESVSDPAASDAFWS